VDKDIPVNFDIAFSPCPNDTFIFHALINQLIDTYPHTFTPHIADVEELNMKAFEQTYAVTKLSFCAYLCLKDRYTLLDSGSALGFGCGPLLVAGKQLESLENARIAVPGRYTTAFLLLRLWHSGLKHVEFVCFDEILPGIASGRFDAGLIIHEGRFVYPSYNCVQIVDLGQWWESQTGLPIPLGCIAIRNDLLEYKIAMEDFVRASLLYARNNPEASRDFIRSQAQEMDDAVIQEHISLYVNEFSLSLGETGMVAIRTLEEKARCNKIL
jgi:1,4-dihydroxy-6-naphthoate synthase